MNLLNIYFTPFATALVLVAIYFGYDIIDTRTRYLSFGVLLASLLVNHWFARNTYRFVGWASRLKLMQVWLTYFWVIPLFYLLGTYWGPMWLLFTMAPVTSAMYQGRWQTFATSVVSGLTMLALYALRASALGLELGEQHWGMAGTHAVFIIVIGMFAHALAETALRMRDIGSRV